MPDNCNETLTQFNARDFRAWKGLSGDCTPNEVFSFLKMQKPTGTAPQYFRGDTKKPASFYRLVFGGYSDPVTMWFRDSTVTCLSVEYPKLTDTAELLEAIGEPEARLDYYYDVALYEDRLYLYASRGLALFMAKKDEKVLKIEAFAPTTVNAYRESVYQFEPPREFLPRE